MRGGGEFAEWCCMCERYVRLVVRVPAGGLMYVYLLYMEIPRFQMAWQGAGATGDRAGLAALGNLNVVINGFLRQIITTLEVTTTGQSTDVSSDSLTKAQLRASRMSRGRTI